MKTTHPTLTHLVLISLIWLTQGVTLWAKDAALSAYSLSVNLSKGSASLQGFLLEAYFTTYDGSAGLPLYDQFGNILFFSGELSPNPAAAGTYRTDYVLFENGSVDSAGTSTATFPVTDADGNGVADFLQVSRSGSVAFNGTVTRQLPSASPALSMSGQLTRSAGSAAGSYVAIIQDSVFGPITYRGSSFLLNAQGTLSYNRGDNTAAVSATVSNEDGTSTTYSGTAVFVVVDANTVAFPAINYSGTDARIIQGKAFTLTRSGKRYLGNVEFQDGGLSTSWRDYTQWRMEITDNNDTDADGIPDLSDNVVVAPTITAHPQPLTVTVGQPVQFSVTAAGTAPLTYQWQREGGNIAGATGATFSIASAQLTNAGDYRVIVRNAAGSATSQPAKLTVNPAVIAPTITGHPQGATVTVGQTVQFSVTVSGSAPLTYQWQRGDKDIPLATGSSYALSNIQLSDAGDYRVVVRNSAGSATSQAAKLVVNAAAVAPTITAHPQSLTATVGQAVQLSVTATGTAPLSYQWRKGDADIPGATSAALAFASVQLTNAGNYLVIVRNSAGQATSSVATLTVNPLVVAMRIARLTLLPSSEIDVDVTVTPGLTYDLEVTPDFKSWTKAQSFTPPQSAATVRAPASASPSRFFRVRESSPGPTGPVITQQPTDQFTMVGQLASFTVGVAGSGPYTYQWFKAGSALSGKISKTLIFFSPKLTDAGTYWVVVTGPTGSTKSDEVTLTVEVP